MASRNRVPTTIWYLELEDLVPSARPLPPGARIERAEVAVGALNRLFYEQIGRDFHWVDRLGWPDERWQAWAEEVETWIVHDRGTPAGYAELRVRPGGEAALEFFGLLAPFRGRGLGGALLTRALERAKALGDGRVTVDTCELDGPHARANYEARGFRLAREAIEDRGRSAG